MNRTWTYIILITALFFSFAVSARAADIVVIVNKDNGNEITRGIVEKIYTGDMSAWPSGISIRALDLPEDSSDRAVFTSLLLGKTVANVKAAWAVKLFSGRAIPPTVVGSDEEVKRLIALHANAIGYIKASSLDNSVKAVLTLK
jgi:ABC-type phosphate transport system substrate-binding protein